MPGNFPPYMEYALFSTIQTTIYLLKAALILATNSLVLAQTESDCDYPTFTEGGMCDPSSHWLACQDKQQLLSCPFGHWVKLSMCPAGTVCLSGFCVFPDDNATSVISTYAPSQQSSAITLSSPSSTLVSNQQPINIDDDATSSAPPTAYISSQPTSVPSPSAKANANGTFGIGCAKFNKAVVAAGADQPTNTQCAGFLASILNGGFTTARELAMFLANVLHESGRLRYKEERKCHKNPKSCDKSYHASCDAPGKTYWGRGYMQLSWCYNYRDASKALYGNEILLDNPDQVATNEEVAWNTSFWYWKAKVHDAFGIQEGHFGASINAINPTYECEDHPPNPEEAQNRKDIYERFWQLFHQVSNLIILDGR